MYMPFHPRKGEFTFSFLRRWQSHMGCTTKKHGDGSHIGLVGRMIPDAVGSCGAISMLNGNMVTAFASAKRPRLPSLQP
jgi:hypothetical protein